MRIPSIIIILSALNLLGCEEELKYDESAPKVLLSIDITAHAESSMKGGVLPVIEISIEAAEWNFSKKCPQLFGARGCALKSETNRFHAGDEIRVKVRKWACMGDDCSIMDHVFILPNENKEIPKAYQNIGSDATATLKARPLKG
jgi:hypothetical protein